MPRASTTSRLADIAHDQWGLVTRTQAGRAGISRSTIARLSSNGVLERVAHGVYRLSGAPTPDHLDLRAAWLQLAPATPAWERIAAQGVVSHRSAAAMYGVGELPADRHQFIVATRRQSRRTDVSLHRRELNDAEWITLRGLPVTRPSRIASDLLSEHEDPGAVARVIAESIRQAHDHAGTFADALAPHAATYGLRRGDGLALLGWLLDLVGDPATGQWMADARAHHIRTSQTQVEDKQPEPSDSRGVK